jgi:predicted metal-binding protein
MSKRVTLSICFRCDEREALFERVKQLRKKRGLKEIFRVEQVRCVRVCETPCNIEYSGEKRSTSTRTRVDAVRDADAVVRAAVAYALLSRGEELPERLWPGISAD